MVVKGRWLIFFFFQAEDGIRDLVRSRGLGDVYKRQHRDRRDGPAGGRDHQSRPHGDRGPGPGDGRRHPGLSLIHI